MNNNRLTKLDGLRGVLSLIVALNHSFLVLAIPAFANVWGQNPLKFTDLQSKLQQVFMMLGNGGVAVTLFFILSGFVLGLSFQKLNFNFVQLAKYLVKRLIRLYPVYIFLVIITAIYMKTIFAYQHYQYASSWFHWWMQFQMTLKEFIYNLLFIHANIGGVTWTLRVILIASIIFPFIYLISKKLNGIGNILFLIALIYSSFTIFDIPNFRDLRYIYMIYSGVILSNFTDFFKRIPKQIIYPFILVSIFVFFDLRYLTDEYLGGLFEAIFGWIFIGLIIYREDLSIFNFLNSSILQYFGKISYSLYLIHFSVLYLLSKFMFETISLNLSEHYFITHLILFAISLGITIPISELVYKYIEFPTLKLSKKITNGQTN